VNAPSASAMPRQKLALPITAVATSVSCADPIVAIHKHECTFLCWSQDKVVSRAVPGSCSAAVPQHMMLLLLPPCWCCVLRCSYTEDKGSYLADRPAGLYAPSAYYAAKVRLSLVAGGLVMFQLC
jgi:hypothetical protein